MNSTKVEYEYPKTPYWFDTQKLNNQPQVQETLALVKHNANEQLLTRVEEMKRDRLAVEQEERAIENAKNELEFIKVEIGYSLRSLVMKYFGLTKDQVLELSDQELETLFDVVFKRARKTAVYMKILGTCIPIFGWLYIYPAVSRISQSYSVNLTYYLGKIKRILGDKFNQVEVIRSSLNSIH